MSARLRDYAQELRELGPAGSLYRIRWELQQRIMTAATPRHELTPRPRSTLVDDGEWRARLPFADRAAVAGAMRERTTVAAIDRLIAVADEAVCGRVWCFGAWAADFGDPPDWQRHPASGRRWNARLSAREALQDQPAIGDVKLTWEIARFPHAYHLARAAAFQPERAAAYAEALTSQIEQFVAANPCGSGVHWYSGQEIAVRALAWLFAADALLLRSPAASRAAAALLPAICTAAFHLEQHLEYARRSVANNHLIAEALGLYVIGVLLRETAEGSRWRRLGREILDEESTRQFYPDGGYFMHAHNYHRAVLQYLLWASAFARADGDRPAASWIRALDRSVTFLGAHMNPLDGRLPNFGANDGSMPSVLSTCEFADFRPVLQAAAVVARGERLFEPGPWDEHAAWFAGVAALDLPLKPPHLQSRSFPVSGYHVARGRDTGSFAAFRCGSIHERFTQIDMLHLDVWWRGQNVLVDGGSFLYNGPAVWHEHFLRTASHNTIALDGRDQMLHLRQFKVVHWTTARMLTFEDHPSWTLCAGEHDGYRRHSGGCIHRRSVLFAKDDVWVVVDRIEGTGRHQVRLQWLGGGFAGQEVDGGLTLATPEGPLAISLRDESGQVLPSRVIEGQEVPPAGWSARHYGVKSQAPSLVVEESRAVPLTWVSVLSAGAARVDVTGSAWRVAAAGKACAFTLVDGQIRDIVLSQG